MRKTIGFVALAFVMGGCSSIFTNANVALPTHGNLSAWCALSPAGQQNLACTVDQINTDLCNGMIQLPMTIPGTINQFCAVAGYPMGGTK